MLRQLTLLPSSAPQRFCGLLLLILTLGLPIPTLAQTLTVQNGGTVEVSNGGTWDLHGATANLGGTGNTASIRETNGARFAGGTLTAIRTLNAPTSADPAGLGIEITASANLGDVTVTRGHAVQTAPNGNASIRRYYDLSPSQNNVGLNATLAVSYNDAELNGRSEAELAFFKSTDGGSTWSEKGVDGRDATANTVTLGGVASLSRWTLGSELAPLPVEWVQFDAAVEASGPEGRVRLTWQTAAETNNAGFEVQRRRTDASGQASWTKVGFVDGAGTTVEPQTYAFTDTDLPYAADVLSYRLRQVDVDGTGHLSAPVRIERTVEKLELLATYPNPAQNRATVRFAVPRRQNVTLRLYDVLGRRVQTVASGPQEGRATMQIGLSAHPSGIYFLQLVAGGKTRTQPLTIAR